MSKRVLEVWDCKYCNTKGIWGNIFDCPGCGKPRSRGVQFYRVENAPEVTIDMAKGLGTGKPNWYCNWCDSGNKDDNVNCWNCGGEKGTAPSHEVKRYEEGEAVPTSTEEAEKADPDGESWINEENEENDESISSFVPYIPIGHTEQHSPPLISRTNNLFPNTIEPEKIRPVAIASLAIIVIALISFLVFQLFFNTHEEIAKISAFSWTQNVSVQEFQAVHDSSWTTHPSDAYNIASSYRDTGRDEKITDGWDSVPYSDTCYETEYVYKTCDEYVSNGDGTGTYKSIDCSYTERQPYPCIKYKEVERYHYEDIYDWYYQYDVNRWVNIANYETSGSDHKPYYFTDFVLSNPYDGNSAPNLGQQQQFEIPGEYSITFFCDNHKVGDEGSFTRNYPLSEWTLFKYDIGYTIEVNAFNGILTHPTP